MRHKFITDAWIFSRYTNFKSNPFVRLLSYWGDVDKALACNSG